MNANADAANPGALNSAGLKALGAGDTATAIALLRRAVAADPASSLLWYNLSTALNIAGADDEENAALDAALDREPYFGHALLAKGRLHERRGDLTQALGFYRRLVAATDPAQTFGPGFTAGLDHARAVLAAQSDNLATRLDAAIGPALAAETPDNTERFRHFVDTALGRRKIYVHQPLVLHYPYLPAEQYFQRHHFPWLEKLEAATPVVRAELQGLLASGGEGFAPYVAYPPGAPVNQWAELNHNDAWAAQFLFQHGVPQDAIRARCPETAALLDSLPLLDLPGRGPVAFFSLLKPHTRIPPHTGATNIRTIIHLPLIVPKGCTFRVGNETRAWIEGEAFAFDDTIEHEAMNPTDELRALLIIDTWNPHLSMQERDWLRHYVKAQDASEHRQGRFDPG
jgi:aspartyl/asparaginyl beta-hydroxylase (cupin superfamily)